MSVTQIQGLVSGLDTKSLIDALVTARSRPIVLMQQRQAAKTSELAAWKSFEAVLVSLKIASERLAESGLWKQLSVETSDPDHLVVNAADGAPTGSWDLFVERLAVAHQADSQTYDSRDALVGSGTLVLETSTGTREVEVAPGTTLAGLADLVNDADAGVQATVVRSAAAGVESFRLVLTAAESGEEHRFTVDASGLAGGEAPAFTQSRLGDDAILRFGGEGGAEVRSSTDTFEDVLDGIDVTVRRAHEAGEATSITVERDTDGLENAIGQFVESYNAMVGFANGQYSFDPESGGRPPLLGSATLSSMVAGIRSRVLGPVAGTEAARFRSLIAAGLRAGGDGTLTFDKAEFREALETDFDAIANLFRVNARSSVDGVTWVSSPDSLALGARSVRLEITQAATRAEHRGSLVDPGAGIPIDDTNDSFRIEIDGVRSGTLRIAHGTYTDGDALAAAVQDAIEDSEELGALSVGVTFEPDAGTAGRFAFTSSRWGSKGSITLLTAGSSFATALGLGAVMNVKAQGQDVAGTVDGVAATGDGRRLIVPEDGGELAGTVFQVALESGVPVPVDFAFTEGVGRGTTRRLAELTDTADGELRRVGDAIQGIIDRYARDIEAKQAQLEQRRTRLEAQYAALESTLAQLQGQGQFVSAQLSALSASRARS